MRGNALAYAVIAIGAALLIYGLMQPLNTPVPMYAIAAGVVAIGIGGGLRKKK